MNNQSVRGDSLRVRTKEFALRILRLWRALPRRDDAEVLGKQLLRCGTSVGANYRSACLAKSQKDFLNKLRICQEEADECCYWLELLMESGILGSEKTGPLLDEAQQLAAIMTASAKTVLQNMAREKNNPQNH